jgi:signal transduction histidine kinase
VPAVAADPVQTSDLIFKRLSLQAPRHYRTWVRTGVAATIVSYSLAFASVQLEQPWATQGHPRELYVIAAGLIAAWLEYKGRLRMAASIILAAIWTELHLSLLTLGARAAVGGVFPAVLTGVILFFGTRAGRSVALSSLISVPAFILAGKYLGLGPGFRAGDLLYVVALEVSTLVIALLLSLLMNTLGGVLGNAERAARYVRGLLDGAPDAIFAVDPRGVIDDCNPGAEALFRRTRVELLGCPFSSLGLIDPEHPDACAGICADAVGAEPREFLTRQFSDPSRKTLLASVPLEGIAKMVQREDGSQNSLVVLRDVSARKIAEERTASLQRQLQHSQKLEALGKLAGGVAHDFNNLLMAVGGYGQALSRHPDPQVQHIAEGLVGLRQRAAGLTGHLLAFARKGMTQPRSMDLARAVTDSRHLLRQLLVSSISLHIDAPSPAFIYADPAQLEQVLMNLAINARDAMPGGGTLNISCRQRGDLERVELCVADTGHGMDEATRLLAFEPFFTTKPRSQGTGLGLALVHGIVEASGGTIRVESTPGLGTCFTLSWRALQPSERGEPEKLAALQHQREN